MKNYSLNWRTEPYLCLPVRAAGQHFGKKFVCLIGQLRDRGFNEKATRNFPNRNLWEKEFAITRYIPISPYSSNAIACLANEPWLDLLFSFFPKWQSASDFECTATFFGKGAMVLSNRIRQDKLSKFFLPFSWLDALRSRWIYTFRRSFSLHPVFFAHLLHKKARKKLFHLSSRKENALKQTYQITNRQTNFVGIAFFPSNCSCFLVKLVHFSVCVSLHQTSCHIIVSRLVWMRFNEILLIRISNLIESSISSVRKRSDQLSQPDRQWFNAFLITINFEYQASDRFFGTFFVFD